MSAAHWQQSFDSLWMSTVDSVLAVLPHMRQQKWGRILAITSIAAREPQPGLVISNSFRAGLLGLVNSVSRDVAKDGITMNALLPGYIATDNTQALQDDPDRSRAILERIPAGRWGRASDLAGAQESSRKAKQWAIWSAVVGLVAIVIYIIVIVIAAMSGTSTSTSSL